MEKRKNPGPARILKREAAVYLHLIKMHILSELQYRGWWMMCVQTAFIVVTDPLGTVLMFSRFGAVGVWSAERILLVYFLAVTSFGLAESLFRGFDLFPWRMIRSGGFDLLLIRPRSLFTQVAASSFNIHRAPRVFTGLFMICLMLHRLGAEPTFVNILTVALALAGGFLTYTGVFVMSCGLAFYTVKGLDWIYLFTNASYQVARCPAQYLPGFLRGVFTFFMPMLVISYYPAAAVCGWGEPKALGFLALPAGAVFLSLSLLVWKVGVRRYQSTGS